MTDPVAGDVRRLAFLQDLLVILKSPCWKADMEISPLCELVSIRKTQLKFQQIRAEYERTRDAVLSISGHQESA